MVRPAQKPARPAVVSRATTGMRAIAIRQPWAWAVIYAGKDCENRSERASRAFQAAVGKRIYVHASKAFPTKAELAHAIKSLRRRGIECPDPNESAEKSQVAIFRCLPGRREGLSAQSPGPANTAVNCALRGPMHGKTKARRNHFRCRSSRSSRTPQ